MYTIGILVSGWFLGVLSIPLFFLFLDLLEDCKFDKLIKWFYKIEGILDGKFYSTMTAEYLCKDTKWHTWYLHDYYYKSPNGTYFEVWNWKIFRTLKEGDFLNILRDRATTCKETRDFLFNRFAIVVKEEKPVVEIG